MLLIQLTGLSGSGKTTITQGVKALLEKKGYPVEVIDGDEYRKTLCRDLGFSRCDREENIRRLGIVANLLCSHGIVTLLSAINPYESVRRELSSYGPHVRTVWVNCGLSALIDRDTKGLYSRALLPDDHPDKINNLTGINDPYEPPAAPHLVLQTDMESEALSIGKLFQYLEAHLTPQHGKGMTPAFGFSIYNQ